MPPLKISPFAIKSYDDEIALAIGRVCIAWNFLELTANQYLADIIPVRVMSDKHILAADLDLRGKLKLLHDFAFTRITNEPMREKLKSIIDRIENEIRPKRNRAVHDHWVFGSGTTQLEFRTKVGRVQSRRPLALSTTKETAIDPADIQAVAGEIQAITNELTLSWGKVMASHPDLGGIRLDQPAP